jgi:hypothetical protein
MPKGKWARKETLIPDIPINVDYPTSEDLHLRISLGACRFKATPGKGEECQWA